jgi:flagellar hook protein FlgE
MSLLGSISTAITGLNAQTNCLGNISDNLANTSTTGFKSIGTNFEDIVATAATGACDTTGMGATATPVYYNSIQGVISGINVDTYMAISGKGFFVVTPEDTTGTATSAGTYYTRSGDFTLDKDGYLANNAGYSLLGWNIDQTTNTVQTGALVPIQFSELVDKGVATTNMAFDANLPSDIAIHATTSDATTTIYDSEGQGHDVTYAWEKTGINMWDLTVTATGGAYDGVADPPADYTATASFTYDAFGQLQTVTSADCAVTGTSLTLPLAFRYTDPDTGTNSVLNQTTVASFDKTTQFADTIIDIRSFAQNGAASGTFSGISIDNNGFASINYDSGVSRVLYQIPLAMFNAPEDLQRKTGGVFQITPTSGTATYSAAATAGAGKLEVGALENSTVDIADQFTRMIQAQRAYSANAKTIITSDSMLQTLITI